MELRLEPRLLAPWLIATALVVVIAALMLGSAGLDNRLVIELRMPRVLASIGVGALLASAGLAMQVLLRNPLADPYVLGTSGGASVGALLALLAGASLWIGSSLGALGSVALLVVLSRSALLADADASPRLILTGAMLASTFGAVTTLLLTIVPDERLRGALFWLVGDLSGADQGPACIGLAVVVAVFMRSRARRLDRLSLGAEAAMLLGERAQRLRAEMLLTAAVSAGAAVSAAGSIGFIGLVIPQVLRLVGVRSMRRLAWMSPVAGAAALTLADLVARTVAAPLELPVGAVVALLGAPLFIYFLRRGPG